MKDKFLIVVAILLLSGGSAPAGATYERSMEDDICADMMGCTGGELKCADYRVRFGTVYISGSCYEDIQPT